MSEPASRSHSRERGRELALLALCHVEGVPEPARSAALEAFWRADRPDTGGVDAAISPLIADDGARRFARRLARGVIERWAEIDRCIETTSQRWRLERMDLIDRALLRLVTAELQGEKTPRGVIIAEAVRLAARFGSERSPVFVNGLAEALASRLRSSTPAGEGSGGDAHGGDIEDPGGS